MSPEAHVPGMCDHGCPCVPVSAYPWDVSSSVHVTSGHVPLDVHVSPKCVPSGVHVSPQVCVPGMCDFGCPCYQDVHVSVSPGCLSPDVCVPEYVPSGVCVTPQALSWGHVSTGIHVCPQEHHWDVCPQVSMCPPTSVSPGIRVSPRTSHTHPHKDLRGVWVALGGWVTPQKTPRQVAGGDTA